MAINITNHDLNLLREKQSSETAFKARANWYEQGDKSNKQLLLVKCNNNKKIKSPNNWVISPLTQSQVANQQKKVPLKYVRSSFQVYSVSAGREGEDPDVHGGHVQVQGEEEEKEAEKSRAANCCHFIVINCFCTTLQLSFHCNQLFLYNLTAVISL